MPKDSRILKVQAIYDKGGMCCKCGIGFDGDNAVIFDFHHKDPKKKEHNIASISTWGAMKKELEKTILVCSNCHRLIHAQMNLQGDGQV